MSLDPVALFTSATSRSTRLADANPPWSVVAVHAVIRFESSTWVAAITAIR